MTRMNPKSCQVKTYTIKTLSLHRRSYNSNYSYLSAHFNKLTLFGDFSLNQALTWLQLCLPEIPDRVNSSSSETFVFNFESTLTETVLLINCSKGSLIFESNNISTISILKDFITREATKKSISIEMDIKVNKTSLNETLSKLYPKLKQLIKAKEASLLIEAVKELSCRDTELMNEMIKNLEKTKDIEMSSLNLQRIYGLITDLFIDYFKLEGSSLSKLSNVKSKLNSLISSITTYASDEHSLDIFIEKLYQFWDLEMVK